MPYRAFRSSSQFTLFLLGFLVLSTPAFAGFQWVSPEASPGPPPVIISPAPVTAAPTSSAATAAPEPVSPVVISGTAKMETPPATTTVTSTTVTTSSAASLDTVRGFAHSVPLAVALRQILPPGYTFSIDPDVDLGVLVSFEGGRPWRDTLRDALEPAGLVTREKGQVVAVGHVEGAPAITAVSTTTRTVTAPPVIETPPVITAASSMPMAMPAGTWQAERGDSLRKVLETWAHRAGVEMNWLAEYDYPIQASVSFNGNFEDAVRNLLTGFSDAHPQPIAELHRNQKMGQSVLVVEVRGNSYSD